MNKIYVGNLPYTVVEADLENLFAAFGAIKKVSLIRDKATRKSKGYAFIEFSDASEADAAVKAMNGNSDGGRPLRVNIAEDRPFGTGGREGGRGGEGGGRGGFGGGGFGGRGGESRGGRY